VTKYNLNEYLGCKAVLVSCYLEHRKKEESSEHLEELKMLADTYGIETVKMLPCHVRSISAATYIREGHQDIIKQVVEETGAKLVIFDEGISPPQQRNLEKALGVSVIDRAEVILGVFAQRAHTKEAQLQVELASLRYLAPRLKRLWTHLSRQSGTAGGGAGGGGAYLKGEGEKQIEIDRRLIRKRIDQLQKEIVSVRQVRVTQRAQRKRAQVPTFALVGYTNAGKSTLMKALTGADVFIENKLFATLDTTTRKLSLEQGQEVLLIDTVGFIRKLPHQLVAAFKSTLEEAVEADILLHVVDASHPDASSQARVTVQVLEELGAKDKPIITVLNKCDLAGKGEISKLRLEYPHTVRISALEKEGIEELVDLMRQKIQDLYRILRLKIPQAQAHLIHKIRSEGRILQLDYEENDIYLRAEIPAALAGQMEPYVDLS